MTIISRRLRYVFMLAGMMLAVIFTASVPAGQEAVNDETEPAKTQEYPAGNPEEIAAVILHTNDVHCGLESNIGYDGLVLYRKELEELYGRVLLVDAGDSIQGSTIGSISKGAEPVKAMNYVGYDLEVTGNHEFDYGFEVLDDCAEQLRCGYTCANFCTADGVPVFPPYRILEAESGLKIGFVGVVTPDAFTKSSIKDILNEVGEPMYDFLADETGERLCRALQGYIDDARADGADYVILVSHLGNNDSATPVFRCDAIVSQLTGLDMVMDGHSHEVYNKPMTLKDGKEIPAAQTGTMFMNIGQLTIYKDGSMEEKLIDAVPAPTDLPSETVTRNSIERYVDPETKVFLDGCYENYVDVLKQKICDLSFDLTVEDPEKDVTSRISENGFCELVADALRELSGAQAVLINAGAVRNDLKAGEVTYNDILNALPYFNEISIVRVTGQAILDALESGTAYYPSSSGRFPQVSGITYTFHPDTESNVQMNEKTEFISVDGDYRVTDVRIGGKELDPEEKYTIAITSFMQSGGDGYSMFKDADIVNVLPKTDDELLIQYIEENLDRKIPETYREPLGNVTIAKAG